MLGIAAVTLIEPDDVHAAVERLRGEAAHVMGVARAVQTVQRDERRPFVAPGLPVAVRRDARAIGNVEVAPRRLRQPRKISRIPPAVQRHRVAAAQRRSRLEGVHQPHDIESARVRFSVEASMDRSTKLLTLAIAMALSASLTAQRGGRGGANQDQPVPKLPANPTFDKYKADVAQEGDGLAEAT